MSSKLLEGKVALVTGAGSPIGLGRAMSVALVQAGARAALLSMRAQKWGRIISVTTSMDTMYRKGNAPYGPSKAGHEALVATMAQELEGSGVTANVLTPGGGSNTNLIPKDASPEYRAAL